jgi:hypothetical protein
MLSLRPITKGACLVNWALLIAALVGGAIVGAIVSSRKKRRELPRERN